MVELKEIMPAVLEHLRENGHLQSYTKWCHLIAENKFPLDNIICFLLFLDIVEWFSKSTTSEMRSILGPKLGVSGRMSIVCLRVSSIYVRTS